MCSHYNILPDEFEQKTEKREKESCQFRIREPVYRELIF